jgi:hypothetical protein
METIMQDAFISPTLEAELRATARADATPIGDIIRTAIEREIKRRELRRKALRRNRFAAVFAELRD